VLQQATVRDLRAAIKPQMVQHVSEQVYLDPQLQESRRGVIDTIPIDSFREVEHGSSQSHKDVTNTIESGNEEGEEDRNDDMIGATRWQKEKKKKEKLLAEQRNTQKPMVREKPPQEHAKEVAKSDPDEKPLSRAERRKKLKEEIIASGQGETFTGYRRRMW
jgi:hypothetical protein